MELLIRDVKDGDADAIAQIYRHHVLHGTASYDIEPPPTAFHLEKVRRIRAAGWPFLVAELRGQLAAYAYVTQFRDRAAYRFTGEDSIYVHPEKMGQGIGRVLLEELVERSGKSGFRTLVAVIGGAEPASIALHRRCGFREVGRLEAVGFKAGKWLDSVYMQR
ncbi:MAG TPA: GNAT family N-acetyltransferase [Sphingomicrobium sp.]|nr:GNAT family N-acetyltransferase [Sphingomicrobium sp.]